MHNKPKAWQFGQFLSWLLVSNGERLITGGLMKIFVRLLGYLVVFPFVFVAASAMTNTALGGVDAVRDGGVLPVVWVGTLWLAYAVAGAFIEHVNAE